MKLQIQTQKLQSCYILPLFVEEKKQQPNHKNNHNQYIKARKQNTQTHYTKSLYLHGCLHVPVYYTLYKCVFACVCTCVFVCVIVYLHVYAIVLFAI